MSFKIQRFAEIPTRDQTILIGDLYFPDTAPPFPAIVFRTPYGRDDSNYRKQAKFFASNGFAFLDLDVRGRAIPMESLNLISTIGKMGRT